MSDDGFKWVVLSGCWLLYFVFGLSVTSLAPLVPEITAELNLSRADMGLVLGAWQFVYIFLAIPVGFALQRLGAGRMLILAAVIIAVSGIAGRWLKAIGRCWLLLRFLAWVVRLSLPVCRRRCQNGLQAASAAWPWAFTSRRRRLRV